MHKREALEAVYRVAGNLEERERARFLRSAGMSGLLDPANWNERSLRSHPLQVPPRELGERRAAMSVLDVVRRINSEPSASRLAGTILEETLSLCGAARGALVLFKKDAPVACVSRDVGQADPAALRSLALRVIQLSLRQGGTLSSGDVPKDPRLAAFRGEADLPRSLLSVPFALRGGVKGAIYLDDPRPDAFSEREIELAGVVAEHGAAAIRLANLKAAMERDSITGALTHAAFEDRLVREMKGATPCSVVLLRVENLKEIQAEGGRDVARGLLRTLARSITRLLTTAVVARHGGGDLEALLPGMSGPAALPVVEDLLAKLRAHDFKRESGTVRLALKAGLASYPADAADARALRRRAEAALPR
jgi:diguanylate cyclase (GGDEF)-like protein